MFFNFFVYIFFFQSGCAIQSASGVEWSPIQLCVWHSFLLDIGVRKALRFLTDLSGEKLCVMEMASGGLQLFNANKVKHYIR